MTFFSLDDWNHFPLTDEVLAMTSPVRCNCGQTYDLGTVTVTGRYADCTVWYTPCCRRQVDDRSDFGRRHKDYTVIEKPAR